MSNHQLRVNFSKNLDKRNRVYISDDYINAFSKNWDFDTKGKFDVVSLIHFHITFMRLSMNTCRTAL